MAATKLTDMVVPASWRSYLIQKTAAKSALWTSGLVVSDPDFDDVCNTGGTVVNMPMFKDLSGPAQVLSDTVPLTVNKISTDNEKAVILRRGNAWGASDLSQALSGTDPLGAIASLIADYRAREFNRNILTILDGVFASASMAASVFSSPTNFLSPSMIIDAKTLLGDASDKLTCFFMHSIAYAQLEKLNLINFVAYSEQGKPMPHYLGKRVIVDDSCPVTSGPTPTVTSYMATEGAFGYGEADPTKSKSMEFDRDALQGEDYAICRWQYLIHPRGMSYVGTTAGSSPTDLELAATTAWNRVYETKNVAMVKIVSKAA